jgi:hypothetical protein
LRRGDRDDEVVSVRWRLDPRAVGAFAATIYTQTRNTFDDQILFPAKSFYDSGDDGSFPIIVVTGTLTGDDLGYPNNTFVIACHLHEKECLVTSAQQIGHNQIGSLDAPFSYPIVKWNAYEVIAQDEAASPVLCATQTITIERKQKSFLWVQEPINQTTPFCKNADTKIHKYTIEDSPGWKQMEEDLHRHAPTLR